MAWGLLDPSGEGDFSPAALLPDFDEAIRQHFANEMSDAERAEYENQSAFLRSSVVDSFTRDKGLVPDFGQPRRVDIVRSPAQLASLFKLLNGLLAVDDDLKKLIEDLEPNSHQFWSLDVSFPKGRKPDRRFWAMVIQNHLSAFRPDESSEKSWRGKPGRYYARAGVKEADLNSLAVSKDAIAGSHIWRDTELRYPSVFFSDELKAQLDERNLRVFRHYELQEV